MVVACRRAEAHVTAHLTAEQEREAEQRRAAQERTARDRAAAAALGG